MTQGMVKSTTVILIAEHPACMGKPRSSLPSQIWCQGPLFTKVNVHGSSVTVTETWQPQVFCELLLSSLFGILVPGLGFALPCDNYNPNVIFSLSE